MGYINKITTPEVGNFPAAVFEQQGEVPIAQCEETQISEINCSIYSTQIFLIKTAAFTAINLTGKKVTVTNSAADDGTYNILAHDDDMLTTDHEFQNTENAVTIAVHDAGQAYLTRNIKSFADFIHNAGYAYTIKGGKLYTDCPNGTLSPACSNTWNPGE